MKKILSLLNSFSLAISTSVFLCTNIISCSIPKVADYDFIDYSYIKDTQKTLEKIFFKWNNIKNNYIKSYMVNNFIIKVDQQKFENNEITIQDINKKVIDIFSSNLRMWKLIENNLTLNPEDLKLELQKIDSVATTSNQYMFKNFSLKLSFKDDEVNVFNIVGKIYNYNFVPIEILNEDTFIELNKNIEKAQNRFISQEAFITIAFNGNKKQNIICTEENIGSQIGEEGCDWDGDQWVSINELKKDNLDFLSVRLRSIGLLPINRKLKIEDIEIDVYSGINSWNTESKPYIDENDSNKIIFKKQNDFGPHSILFKTNIRYSKDSNEKIEIWGSYLKKEINY